MKKTKNHEYSLSHILVHSWQLYKNNFWLFIFLVAAIYLPIDILNFYAPDAVVGLFSFLITPISVMAIAYSVSQLLKSKKVTFQEAMSKALARLPWAIGTSILGTIFLLGLFLLLIVPGIIYSVYWAFALYAVMLHHEHGRGALAYSKSVVKGRWWKVLGYMFALGLLAGLLVMAITFPLILSFTDFESTRFLTPYPWLDLSVNLVIYAVMAFFQVAFALFFINLDATKKTS